MAPRHISEVDTSAVDRVRTSLRGELILPGDEAYDRARTVHNAMIDRRPAMIVRCAGVADVMSALSFARRNGLCLSVRGGGHHVTGNAVCDDGMVIDLSRMKGLRVDPAARTARAEAGLTWGELNRELQAFGLGATGGHVSITGIPGLTLGGGFGWLTHKHGLALDNLRSVDVVTADGRLLTASADRNADLFWGMRGAGANFGVATHFEFEVHPVGTVLAGPILHPFESASEVLRMFRAYSAIAPDDLTWGLLLFTVPELPTFPPPLRGQPVAVPAICWAGPLDEGEEFLQPIREFGPPLADLVRPISHDEVQVSADFIWPPGYRNYWKSSFVRDLSDSAIDTIVEHFAEVPSPRTAVVLNHVGGAVARVGAADTAFPHRSWTWNLLVTSAWRDPADDASNIGWTREFWSAMRPFLADALYVNYTSDQGADAVRSAYPPDVHARLVALKDRYDPENVFRMNHNIAPSRPSLELRGGIAADSHARMP